MTYTLTEQKEKLKQALTIVLENLQKQGLLPQNLSDDKKELIIDEAVEKILKNTPNVELALKDNSARKALSLVLIGEFLADAHPNNPHLKLEYDNLFDKTMPTKELQLKLAQHFAQLLTAMNELQPKPEFKLSRENIQQQAERLSLNCTQHMDKEGIECLAENEKAMNCLATLTNDLLSDTLSNLYGMDPRTGAVKCVFVFKGNAAGIADKVGDNETSNAPIDVINRYDGTEDPLGIENSIRERLDAMGTILEANLDRLTHLSPHPDHG